MKKTLALLLALVMVLGLAACGQSSAPAAAPAATEAPAAAPAAEAPAAAPAAEAKTFKVGVAIYQFDDNFMTLYRNELQSYFKSLETDSVKYDVTIVDGKNDMAEQNNQIDNFITQGMDAIILNLVQTSSADAAIAKIVDAGIPCILINREPLGDNGDESYAGILDNATVCYVGADARQSGTYQGEIIAELPDHGDINGDGKVSYIMIEGDPENVDAQYRTEFSIKALKDAGIEVEELDDQIGNWAQAKGQEICANDLAKFGDAIEVVFCNNDAMALGAATAITAAGRTVGQDIYLVGVDALDECVEMVNEGTMTGTVLNDAVGQSHTAVDVTVDALNGKAINNYYWVDYVKVTAGEAAAPAEEAAAPAEAAAVVMPAAGTYKIGVAIYQFDDNFMTLYRNELLSYFKSLETDDVKFDVTIVDGKNDMAEQNNQIDNFITQGMDAIILNLVQTSSADAAIAKIVDAGIPCILINREPLGDNGDESYAGILDNATVCYVGADARQSGTYQGEIIAELPDHGDINGDGKVSYIMIEGDPENVDAQYRTEFSIKALKDAGIEVEELDDQIGNWAQAKGQEICANDLAKFGDAVEVVFCNNDAMALGAATAITAAGRTVGQDIYLVGVDALEECQQMVQEGTMTGTVLNDHIGQSHKAVDVTLAALAGAGIQNYYWVDYVKVTK